MRVINTDQWSRDKEMMHPNRSEVNINSFTKSGKTWKIRALLECERRFFNNKSEINFAEANSEFFINLLNRERDSLVLDGRVC